MLHLSCIFEIYIFIELIKEKQPSKIQTGIGLVNFVSMLNLDFLKLNVSSAVYLIESTDLEIKMSQLFFPELSVTALWIIAIYVVRRRPQIYGFEP